MYRGDGFMEHEGSHKCAIVCREVSLETVQVFFFSSRRRHTRYWRDWSSDVCSSDLSGPPIMLESLGIAKRGEGVHFFADGRSTPGGTQPINTNGGGLSYTHSGMYGIFPIIEATRQLRGERSEERRVGKEGRRRGSTD